MLRGYYQNDQAPDEIHASHEIKGGRRIRTSIGTTTARLPPGTHRTNEHGTTDLESCDLY
jgi:hypothetical protein